MQLRKDIPDIYKWDIGLFKTKEEIEQAISYIEELTNKAPSYYGKFKNPDVFFDFFYSDLDKTIKIHQLYFYVSNMQSIDGADIEIKKLIQRLEFVETKHEQAYSFVGAQMSKLPIKYLKELLLDPRAKDIENTIKSLIISKKHALDEKTSKTVADLTMSFVDNRTVFDIITDMEMPFEDAVDSKGITYPVKEATYSQYIISPDRKLRETAFNSIMNGYKNFNQTFGSLYIKEIQADDAFVKLAKFKTKLEKTLFDYVPEKVFRNNIKFVTENISSLQEFVSAVAKESKLNDFAYYDLFADEKISGDISIEEGQKIIIDALSPLGADYVNRVKHKFSDKSIDYLPNKDKTSGAYCANCYNAKTLILMNWVNDFDSVSTLAHEMGHCINAEYFNEFQPIFKAEIPIFSAEIASTVNEILLNQHMLKTCKVSEKSYYLKEFLNQVRSTIFRQTLFTEFELYAHESIENETPITQEELNNKYFELNQKYYGSSCVLPENLKYEWSRIPHFYRPYYVFTYSTGLITAITIAQKLLNEKDFAEKYIYFLKNGSNKKPVEILKEIGIDLTTDKPYQTAFNFINEQLKIYKSLCK